MTDRNELQALHAALRGAIAAAGELSSWSQRLGMATGPDGDISGEDLEALARVTLAHAVAAQALRGLVESMRTRRS